jgi:acylphosphatase
LVFKQGLKVANRASLHIVVSGHVQGVFFRAFVAEKATQLGLKGFVRNLPNGIEVEVQAEGDKEQLIKLLDKLKTGPPGAEVEKIVSNWGKFGNKYSEFIILY